MDAAAGLDDGVTDRPEPMILPNGDVLAPAEDGTMRRVPAGTEAHTAWVRHIQRHPRNSDETVWDDLLLALLIPIAGVVLAVVLLTRGRGSAAGAVLVTALLGAIVWLVALTLVGVLGA